MAALINLQSQLTGRPAPQTSAATQHLLDSATFPKGRDKVQFTAPVYPSHEARAEVEVPSDRLTQDQDLADIRDAMVESHSQYEGTRHG